jgi:hypothetical protein|tara:strand:+ start:653 stop:1129 length:477 start_codon:yes stop_codon:yes gene_type:complete
MARKKIVREPVEKLSSDNIVEITEDSSSEEESDLTPIIKPKAVKKPRTPKQLANDQRLRDLKKKVAEPVNELDKTTHPVKPVPIADVDPEDKPMTARQMKAYMAQMNQPKPMVKKPRKPRATKADMAARKVEKVVNETPVTPPPPPPLVRAKPQMMFV